MSGFFCVYARIVMQSALGTTELIERTLVEAPIKVRLDLSLIFYDISNRYKPFSM